MDAAFHSEDTGNRNRLLGSSFYCLFLLICWNTYHGFLLACYLLSRLNEGEDCEGVCSALSMRADN